MNTGSGMPSQINSLDNRQGFADLRRAAQKKDPESIKTVAKHFESLFINIMLKEMRNTLPDGPLSSSQQKQFTEMFDQQLAVNLAQGEGIGLAKSIERQLALQHSAAPQGLKAPVPLHEVKESKGISLDDKTGASQAIPLKDTKLQSPQSIQKDAKDKELPEYVLDFVKQVWPAAERAAKRLKVSTKAIVAQAALETGWGRHVAKNQQGQSSHNFFGIKALRDWAGEQVDVKTTEFEHGKALKKIEPFRAYESVEHSFDDYAQFLLSHPRYKQALNAGQDVHAFSTHLQNAGYATDPKYADKIRAIVEGDPLNQAIDQLKISSQVPITVSGDVRTTGV